MELLKLKKKKKKEKANGPSMVEKPFSCWLIMKYLRVVHFPSIAMSGVQW
jgi:hypothetical protein